MAAMLWGAGRLLWRAWRARSATLTPLRGGMLGSVTAGPRSVRRLGVAVLAIGLLGPGVPFVASVVDHQRGTSEVSAMGGAFEPPAGDSPVQASAGWEASISVSGPDLASDLPPPPPAAKRTALIIGINNARGGRPLPGSITDATNVRDALLGYGFLRKNIKLLVEKKATAAAIRQGLDELARRTPADGVAVFSVATHTRMRGGQNEFLTADGLRISARELGASLARVRSKMWVALPTCYAGGYAVDGIVGKGRVTTFASSSTQPTYQLGTAGSYLIMNMVREGMLNGHAPSSVEDAFRYAERTLQETSPDRVPIMSDGVKGKLVLGKISSSMLDHQREIKRAEKKRVAEEKERFSASSGEEGSPAAAQSPDEADESPEPQSPRKRGVGVCGRFSYNCSTKK